MDSIYTRRERTERDWSVGQALAKAQAVCRTKEICVNAISGRALDEKITLEQLNDLADQLIDDTSYGAF